MALIMKQIFGLTIWWFNKRDYDLNNMSIIKVILASIHFCFQCCCNTKGLTGFFFHTTTFLLWIFEWVWIWNNRGFIKFAFAPLILFKVLGIYLQRVLEVFVKVTFRLISCVSSCMRTSLGLRFIYVSVIFRLTPCTLYFCSNLLIKIIQVLFL